MELNAKKDVLNALEGAYAAVKGGQIENLHGLSDHIVHSMSIYNDKEITNVAVAIYALAKIFETEKYKKHKKIKEFTKAVLSHMDDAIFALKRNDLEKYSNTLQMLFRDIEGFSKRIRFYIEDVLNFSKIKKSSKLYEHGLSLGQAAEATGVTKWELMPMTGETTTHEKFVEPIVDDERKINLVRKLFKLK